ncbi:MAG: tRNA(Ile)-lysidine synthase [Thermoleophilia bacterium]|nr:tRNA(Ile)-lysidine synthase [Thermoleophilia bacterium]
MAVAVPARGVALPAWMQACEYPRMDPDQAIDRATIVARGVRRMLDESGASLARRRVLALCSGGADSVALVHVLGALPTGAAPASVDVLWLDHGLRIDVADERAAAAAAADAIGAGFVTRSAAADALRTAEGGLEGAARAWRYGQALDVARARGCDVVATGHTANDQLECALLGMVGVAGVPGELASMHVRRSLADGIDLVRPLLGSSRADVEALCLEVGARWHDDPTNADSRAHARNTVRSIAIPELLALHPGAGRALVRGADRRRETGQVLESLVRALLDSWGDDPRSIDVRRLARLDAPTRRAVVARWLLDARIGRDVGARTIAAVDALATLPRRAACARVDLPRGACVRRDGYHLVLTLAPRHGRPHP